jgi:DNA excision repair protein ERCC-1
VWSKEEAACYLETYKAFDGKDASSIQLREQSLFANQVVDVLSLANGQQEGFGSTLVAVWHG